MPTNRKIAFVNTYYYHVFNRGIDKRVTFSNKREYRRALETLRFYQYSDLSVRFSWYLKLSGEEKTVFMSKAQDNPKQVSVLAYCFMPNHFHFLVRQEMESGISRFVANFSNSYTKYFNARHKRVGPLFQGLFKAVFVEDDSQLLHLSRYIHLNPFVSSIVKLDELEEYEWSSYPSYISGSDKITDNVVLSQFKTADEYKNFVTDYAGYASELKKIKHLLVEGDV